VDVFQQMMECTQQLNYNNMKNKFHIKFDYTDPILGDLKPFDIKVCDYIVTTIELAVMSYDKELACFHEPVMFEKSGIDKLRINRIK